MKMSITSKSALTPAGELLTWDSEFWGMNIGRAHTSEIDQWAKENMVGSVCLLISANEPDEIQAAEERGFRFMDMRVTLGKKTSFGATNYVRAFALEDVDNLVKIARESHRITRFYADPRFDDQRCDDLYEAWIRSSCRGWADTVLVVTNKGEAVGYITLHLSGDESSIGLIAVKETERGRGLGLDLVNGAEDWCYRRKINRVTVVTQGRNIAALRLFERCGFRIEKTEVWLHRWFQ